MCISRRKLRDTTDMRERKFFVMLRGHSHLGEGNEGVFKDFLWR